MSVCFVAVTAIYQLRLIYQLMCNKMMPLQCVCYFILLIASMVSATSPKEAGTNLTKVTKTETPPVCLNDTISTAPADISSCRDFDTIIQMGQFEDMPSIPTLVNITVYFEKLYAINTDSDLHLVIYVESMWHDPRIINLMKQFGYNSGKRRCLLPSYKVFGRMWYPVLNFHVSGDVKTEKLPGENTFLAMSPNGNVYLRSKYEMFTPCWVNLRKFPMDEAICRITITNLESDPGLVTLRWSEGLAIATLLNTDTAEHHLFSIKNTHRLVDEIGVAIDHLTIDMKFHRHVGWYLMFAYFPAYLIILISWLYTTLGTETRASRLQLRASLLLALVLMIYHILRQIPKVNYVKAIDVFMIMVLGFLTSSCVEDTIVTWCCNRAQRLEKQSGSKKKPARRSRSCSAAYTPQFIYSNMLTSQGNTPTVEDSETDIDNNNVDADYGPCQPPPSSEKQKIIHNYSSTDGSAIRALLTNNMCLVNATAAASCKEDGRRWPTSIQPSWTKAQRYRILAEKIDHVFIYLYPCLFFTANIIYWLYYSGVFGYV